MKVKKYITSKSELTMKIRPFQAEASSPGAVTASSQLGLHRKTSTGMDTYCCFNSNSSFSNQNRAKCVSVIIDHTWTSTESLLSPLRSATSELNHLTPKNNPTSAFNSPLAAIRFNHLHNLFSFAYKDQLHVPLFRGANVIYYDPASPMPCCVTGQRGKRWKIRGFPCFVLEMMTKECEEKIFTRSRLDLGGSDKVKVWCSFLIFKKVPSQTSAVCEQLFEKLQWPSLLLLHWN